MFTVHKMRKIMLCFSFSLAGHEVHAIKGAHPRPLKNNITIIPMVGEHKWCMHFELLFTDNYSTLGWSVEFFFWMVITGQLTKGRYGFRSTNPNFRQAHAARHATHVRQIFHLKKNSRCPNNNIFLWKLAWGFLLQKRTNAEKIFFIFSFCFNYKNNRRSNVILISIFENAQKQLLTTKNRQNGVFDSQ